MKQKKRENPVGGVLKFLFILYFNVIRLFVYILFDSSQFHGFFLFLCCFITFYYFIFLFSYGVLRIWYVFYSLVCGLCGFEREFDVIFFSIRIRKFKTTSKQKSFGRYWWSFCNTRKQNMGFFLIVMLFPTNLLILFIFWFFVFLFFFLYLFFVSFQVLARPSRTLNTEYFAIYFYVPHALHVLCSNI